MSDINNTNYDAGASAGTQGGSRTGQKIRGATEVIHGIGENIRGRFMDVIDSSTNTGSSHPETHAGRAEVERGMAKLTGGPGATGGTPTTATSTSYDTQQQSQSAPGYRSSESAQVASQGDVLGPTSAMTAGFGNFGPEGEVAEAPNQPRYSPEGTGAIEHGTNDRDFGYSQAHRGEQGGSPGPAPDRYAMGGEPMHLA